MVVSGPSSLTWKSLGTGSGYEVAPRMRVHGADVVPNQFVTAKPPVQVIFSPAARVIWRKPRASSSRAR